MIQTLILREADINAKDVDGNTPSHFCSEYGHIDCLRFLLLQNPSLFSKNKDGLSPLDVALNKEILEIFQDYIKSVKKMLKNTSQEASSGSATPVDKSKKASSRTETLKMSKASSSSNSTAKLSANSNTRNIHNRSPTSESAPKISIKKRETSATQEFKLKSATSSGREKFAAKIAHSKKKSTNSGASSSGGGQHVGGNSSVALPTLFRQDSST